MTRPFVPIATLALVFWAAAPAQAQSLAVSASLSEHRIAVGDVVTVEISAATDQRSGNVVIDVPPIDGLRELNRSQSESSSWQVSGGRQTVRRERTMRVEYEAAIVGRFTIGSIRAEVGGRRATANALTFEVVASNVALAQAPIPGQVFAPRPEEGQVFVRYRVDKASAYLGEQIILDLDIIASGSFNVDNAKGPPALDGFWREVLERPNRLTGRDVTINGRRWRAYRLWRVALFPLQAGARTIPRGQYGFSMNRGMFSGGKRINRAAPPIKIEVLPLPTEGRPPGFVSTNVGEYRLVTRVDRQRVPAGKAVVLHIELSGSGNVKSVQLPKADSIPGFRSFPPTLKDSINNGPAGVSGVKRAEMILMPLKGGRLEIPPLELTTFRPSTKAYQRLTTPAIPIFVEGDPSALPSAPAVPVVANPLTAEIKRSDLAPLRFKSALTHRTAPLATRPLYAALMSAPPFLFLLALLAETFLTRLRRQSPASRRKAAARHAHERLKQAEATTGTGNPEATYAQINEALLEFASERSGVAIRGLTMNETREALSERGAEAELISRLITELEHCDFARFAPGGQDPDAVREALDRASTVLTDLEAWEPT